MRLLASVFASFLLAAGMRAQEAWTGILSPTTQDLWSVTWGVPPETGAGRFVAVGRGGTLLTSADGQSWTSGVSGTTRWLVNVAFANNLFVAVGDQGTLLTSSDTVTWTARASGTTERLNAVGYGNDRWLAVGENGSAVTSLDGQTWSAVPPSDYGWTTPLAGYLHGFCFAYGTFVGTGAHGHIVATADANHFYDRSVATPANFEGVTYARHRFVAVGDNGLVLSSPDAVTWRGSLAPTGLRAVTFCNNTFVGAGIDGSVLTSPDAASWTVRGTSNSNVLTAIAGNANTIVAVGLSGTIVSSTAAQAAPVVATSPPNLTEAAGNNVRLSVTATGTAPLSYQWRFEGKPIPGATDDVLSLSSIGTAHAGRYSVVVTNSLGSATSASATLTVVSQFAAPGEVVDPTFVPWQLQRNYPTALLVQPDGRIVAAYDGATVARLQADGALDNSFSSQAFAGVAKIEALARQSDGKILVGGVSTSGVGFLSRLGGDGRIDPSFAGPMWGAGSITDIALQPDGRILIANNTPRLIRLNVDGTQDAKFNAVDLTALAASVNADADIHLVAVAPGGRITVATAATPKAAFPYYPSSAILIAQFGKDGSLDPAFTPRGTGLFTPRLLAVQADGKVLLGSDYNYGYFNSGSWKLQRLNADGSDDATFLTQTGYIAKYGGSMRAGVDAAGRIVVAVTFQNVTPGFQVLRFLSDGTIDSTLRASSATYGLFNNLLTALVPASGDQMLIAGQNRFQRLVAENAPRINPPAAFDDSTPPPITITSGSDVTITTPGSGTAPFTRQRTAFYDDRSSQSPYVPDSESVTLENVRTGASVYTRITNPAGTITAPPQRIRVPPLPPSFAHVPADVTANEGRIAALSFQAQGSGPLRYTWFFNGQAVLSGVSSPEGDNGTLWIYSVDATNVGTYRLVLSNPLGTAEAKLTLSIDNSSRLIDVSTRGFVGTGDAALIAGFSIRDADKWVLIRGVGPGLAPFGVTGFLPNPRLTLFDSTGAKVDENAGWVGTNETYSTLNWPATFALTEGSGDALISRRLPPGNYTVRLSGVGDATGVALAEVYENIHEATRLTNLSSRVSVGTGAQVAISGIVVGGGIQPKKLLIRAVGPGLLPFGITSALADPYLLLVDEKGVEVAANDNWGTNPNKDPLIASMSQVGAFPLADGSKDAVLLVTLPPGSYSAVVKGVGDTTGVALVEVYEAP